MLAAEETGGGKFLVTPSVGLMIWTLLAFGMTLYVLRRFVFPRIQEQLDKRQRAIEETIETAERTRKEAEQMLAEYRERLQEARQQAEDIVARARKAAERHQEEIVEARVQKQQEMLEQARRDIETETRLALERIRKEVADLTVIATEKVTRKTLTSEDHQRLIQEALQEVDFSVLETGRRGTEARPADGEAGAHLFRGAVRRRKGAGQDGPHPRAARAICDALEQNRELNLFFFSPCSRRARRRREWRACWSARTSVRQFPEAPDRQPPHAGASSASAASTRQLWRRRTSCCRWRSPAPWSSTTRWHDRSRARRAADRAPGGADAHVDDDILGGLVVRVSNMVLDASIRNQLERLRARRCAKSGTKARDRD